MNVRELIEKLSKLDPELLVVLSSDAEGNDYHKCSALEGNFAFFDSEIKLQTLTPKLIDSGYSEEDVAGPEYKPCVVLWP